MGLWDSAHAFGITFRPKTQIQKETQARVHSSEAADVDREQCSKGSRLRVKSLLKPASALSSCLWGPRVLPIVMFMNWHGEFDGDVEGRRSSGQAMTGDRRFFEASSRADQGLFLLLKAFLKVD